MARKRTRLIIGLMSGTSLDGLDVALCACSGHGSRTRVKVLQFKTVPYEESFKDEIRRVFAKQMVELQHLTILNEVIANRHSEIVLQCLSAWNLEPSDVDLIASHGQTIFHAPRIFHGLPSYPNATLQLGDGDHLAHRTGIITLCDFRQKHLAAGGEGAPLALYGDYLLFFKKREDRFLLNIGGIANFTYLPGDGDAQKAFATDTGPGNTLLDAYARALFEVDYDRDALLASAGRVDPFLLDRMLEHPYFSRQVPKTTGPEQFSRDWVEGLLEQYPKGRPNYYDIMATLTQLTADTIADALLAVPPSGFRKKVYLSGGGAHNPVLIKILTTRLKEFTLRPMSALGIDGDAKEAVLFAVLANETVAGSWQEGVILGGIPMVSMGKICFP